MGGTQTTSWITHENFPLGTVLLLMGSLQLHGTSCHRDPAGVNAA